MKTFADAGLATQIVDGYKIYHVDLSAIDSWTSVLQYLQIAENSGACSWVRSKLTWVGR